MGTLVTTEFLQTLYRLDTLETREDMFDWVYRRTDEICKEGDFDGLNAIFDKADGAKLSASAITAMLRSTYMVRNLLPARTEFKSLPVVIARVRAVRSDADEMLKKL